MFSFLRSCPSCTALLISWALAVAVCYLKMHPFEKVERYRPLNEQQPLAGETPSFEADEVRSASKGRNSRLAVYLIIEALILTFLFIFYEHGIAITRRKSSFSERCRQPYVGISWFSLWHLHFVRSGAPNLQPDGFIYRKCWNDEEVCGVEQVLERPPVQ